jgi:hypothetical protein
LETVFTNKKCKRLSPPGRRFMPNSGVFELKTLFGTAINKLFQQNLDRFSVLIDQILSNQGHFS